MKKIPLLLILSRVLFGIAIIALSLVQSLHFRNIIIVLMIVGLLSDIFDGIIARRLNVSSPTLRRLDSGIDQFFWLCIVAGCYITCPQFFKDNMLKICILIAMEAGCYAISYIRFGKEVATHAISSKFWTLILLATMIQVTATCSSVILFNICFYLGIATRMEIIGMLLIIKQWTNDIPTIYHAILIRNGKEIKRHKLFNG
ncbi:CDP-alcohol phosphatidyltransferase family protein [Mucilaginibacter sp.]|uniref:CDP-alcohol phosphatidyltransferase family protein n=1 Tax=Mucilaginibacter sp. TaxID=1882438 RepID=UPI002ED39CF6